jgi:hypothetical protein
LVILKNIYIFIRIFLAKVRAGGNRKLLVRSIIPLRPFYCHTCCLGGVMVSVLAIKPKVHRFKPGQDYGF